MFCSIHIIPADKNVQHFLILAWKDIRLKCGPIDEVVYNYRSNSGLFRGYILLKPQHHSLFQYLHNKLNYTGIIY